MIHARFLLLFLLCSFPFIHGCSDIVKEPSVAGSFYPSDKNTLTETVDALLSSSENRAIDGKLIALISPHAGYRYSGATAAHTYKHLRERDVKTVILIGPSHHKPFRGASVYERGKMKTPLGLIQIDHKIAASLINKDADVFYDPDAFEKEHSLEVQLPFLQRVLKKFKIVPVLIGTPTKRSFDFLTARLTKILKENKKTILIASTDFSHYHDYKTAVRMDKKTIGAIERMSVEDVQRYRLNREGEMCGFYPVLHTMAVARNLGATNGVLYKYENSGDVTGEKSRVVGYAAIGLYRTSITESEKDKLLELAKDTIMSYVKEGKTPAIDINSKRLKANGATFVTIKTNGGLLRGCMGNIEPYMPLYQSVITNAVNACSKDPRFLPMEKIELNDIDIEVSVLSPLEPLQNINEIEIGKHGLYLVKENRRGLLLPQIPVENGWDRDTFLKQVSKKAGLPEDAWKDAHLYSFTAEIIR